MRLKNLSKPYFNGLCHTCIVHNRNQITKKKNRWSYLLRGFGEQRLTGLPLRALHSPLSLGHGWEAVCEAAAVPLRLCVRRGVVEVSVAVAPCVSEGAGSLPVRRVCQGLKLDVALTPGVCVLSDSSRGRELLLLLCCNNSAAFCRHSHAVVLWKEAKKKGQSQTGCVTHKGAQKKKEKKKKGTYPCQYNGKKHAGRGKHSHVWAQGHEYRGRRLLQIIAVFQTYNSCEGTHSVFKDENKSLMSFMAPWSSGSDMFALLPLRNGHKQERKRDVPCRRSSLLCCLPSAYSYCKCTHQQSLGMWAPKHIKKNRITAARTQISTHLVMMENQPVPLS